MFAVPSVRRGGQECAHKVDDAFLLASGRAAALSGALGSFSHRRRVRVRVCVCAQPQVRGCLMPVGSVRFFSFFGHGQCRPSRSVQCPYPGRAGAPHRASRHVRGGAIGCRRAQRPRDGVRSIDRGWRAARGRNTCACAHGRNRGRDGCRQAPRGASAAGTEWRRPAPQDLTLTPGLAPRRRAPRVCRTSFAQGYCAGRSSQSRFAVYETEIGAHGSFLPKPRPMAGLLRRATSSTQLASALDCMTKRSASLWPRLSSFDRSKFFEESAR